MTPAARLVLILSSVLLIVTNTSAQSTAPQTEVYTRRNTFTLVAEYSNDSSHILLGVTPNRKFTALGAQYERRLLHRHNIAWSYAAELRPLVFESDPLASGTETFMGTAGGKPINDTYAFGPYATLKCTPGTTVYTGPGSDPFVTTTNTTCGRQWSYAQGVSPLGTRVNLRTHHRLQPTVSGFGGYLFSTHPIPLAYAGSFNFTFEIGAGLELFRSTHRSLRVEYNIQHFSNHFTANQNPGVDNGLFKLTYAFGR